VRFWPKNGGNWLCFAKNVVLFDADFADCAVLLGRTARPWVGVQRTSRPDEEGSKNWLRLGSFWDFDKIVFLPYLCARYEDTICLRRRKLGSFCKKRLPQIAQISWFDGGFETNEVNFSRLLLNIQLAYVHILSNNTGIILYFERRSSEKCRFFEKKWHFQITHCERGFLGFLSGF